LASLAVCWALRAAFPWRMVMASCRVACSAAASCSGSSQHHGPAKEQAPKPGAPKGSNLQSKKMAGWPNFGGVVKSFCCSTSQPTQSSQQPSLCLDHFHLRVDGHDSPLCPSGSSQCHGPKGGGSRTFDCSLLTCRFRGLCWPPPSGVREGLASDR